MDVFVIFITTTLLVTISFSFLVMIGLVCLNLLWGIIVVFIHSDLLFIFYFLFFEFVLRSCGERVKCYSNECVRFFEISVVSHHHSS